MATNKKLVGAAAIAAGVGVGTLAGAMFGAPSPSGAAESTATAPAHGGGGLGSAETAAEALGMSEDDLRAALEDGQTIAEVAAAQGVDVQTVIDALVAEGNERIDEALADGDITQEEADERKADLAERVTDFVNGEAPFGGGGFGRGGFGPGGFGGGFGGGGFRGGMFGGQLDSIADVLGVTEDELQDALADGQSLSEIAEANGVDRQAVVDALVADATERIEDMVDQSWGD